MGELIPVFDIQSIITKEKDANGNEQKVYTCSNCPAKFTGVAAKQSFYQHKKDQVSDFFCNVFVLYSDYLYSLVYLKSTEITTNVDMMDVHMWQKKKAV